ncbi:hypothetical protein SDC9_151913 [bioreactor metagenome]|uniref:Uncharacterized protein n=1 Tax=bioreactor metagenome TaxID=1076179 RepID=A0A645ERJ7_9ZZZZ
MLAFASNSTAVPLLIGVLRFTFASSVILEVPALLLTDRYFMIPSSYELQLTAMPERFTSAVTRYIPYCSISCVTVPAVVLSPEANIAPRPGSCTVYRMFPPLKSVSMFVVVGKETPVRSLTVKLSIRAKVTLVFGS